MNTKNSTYANHFTTIPTFHKQEFEATLSSNNALNCKGSIQSTIDLSKLHYKELTKLAEKQKWMKRFRKAYRGLLNAESDRLYTDQSKFIVACYGPHDIGFLRLTDDSDVFSEFTTEKCWDITDGYVKPAYQSVGILRAFIQYAIANLNAKSVTLAYEVAAEHNYYYNSLGFTVVLNLFKINCVRLYLTEWEEMLANTCHHVVGKDIYSATLDIAGSADQSPDFFCENYY